MSLITSSNALSIFNACFTEVAGSGASNSSKMSLEEITVLGRKVAFNFKETGHDEMCTAKIAIIDTGKFKASPFRNAINWRINKYY